MKPTEGIAVDGACSGNPGPAEYQGVDIATGKQLFHVKLKGDGTNNIAEYLAIVHAIHHCQENNIKVPIYSDSQTAMAWVRKAKCNTTLKSGNDIEITKKSIDRADTYLRSLNLSGLAILKWKTREWGETVADFGRK